jgi:Putative transposase
VPRLTDPGSSQSAPIELARIDLAQRSGLFAAPNGGAALISWDATDETGVTFRWKDYRIEGPGRYQTMTLPTHEFIRRFQMHVLPKEFRHCGLFASGNRITNIAPVRQLFSVPVPLGWQQTSPVRR